MKNRGYDATRRNRNIGTAKSGLGKNNKFRVPDAWVEEESYWERLEKAVSLELQVHGRKFPFLVESVHKDFYHAVTPAEAERVLNLFPQDHIADLDFMVLRQQKTKERALEPKWGCFLAYSTTGKYIGKSIHLCSQEKHGVLKWRKSLTPEWQAELRRLEQDGHVRIPDPRVHRLQTSLEACRNTQLYHTLAHEVGHHVDAMDNFERPGARDLETWKFLFDRYYSRPSREREEYAHRYAREFHERQIEAGNLPIPRLLDFEKYEGLGLRPEWFEE